MNILARFQRMFASSLAFRWVLSVTLAAGLGIGALLLVTEQEMKYQVGAQADAVHHLASLRLAQQSDASIGLVQERLHDLFTGLEKSLEAIATLRSTQAAVKSRNDVWIAEEIGRKLRQVGFTGAIVMDQDLRVIGADHSGASLLFSNDTLQVHELRQTLESMLVGKDRSNPGMHRFSGIIDPSMAAILLAQGESSYGLVLGVPVFDDFGDTSAIILAYRTIRMSEDALNDFSRITGAHVALLFGPRVIAMTGTPLDEIHLRQPDAAGLHRISELEVVARCRPVPAPLSICILEPESSISRLGKEIMAIGLAQFEKTRTTLYSIGLFSLVLMLLVLILLGRRLARPLSEIAASVDRVAQGAWKVEVPHALRHDEVGRIARALVQMQLSLAERDRMRVEMTRINEINSRRLVLDNAVVRFEDRMAVVMKDISDTVRALGSTNAVLDEAARRADSEAEKIRLASLATASRTTSVSLTTETLSRSIRTIGERVKKTSNVVNATESHAQTAEAQLGAANVATAQVESALGTLQGFVADLGHLSLKASLEAMEAGEAGTRFAPLARAVSELSVRAAASADAMGAEIHRLATMNDNASEAVGEIRGVLGDALRETSEITVAICEQDAATREIVDGLANSAQALISLADAVDQLRTNMASAHEASSEFVMTARRIAEDAKAIDGSVRNFVRDVVA
jgi:methyl-accepting chemotaxis protein